MHIIDTHCDALLKLQGDFRNAYRSQKRLLDFKNSGELDTNAERLRKGNVKVQFFAIFIPPNLPDDEKWQHALEQVDCFYNEVIIQDNFVHIKNFSEIRELKSDEIGAVLTLEGSDAFGNDLMKLRMLIRLGVLSLGLVWNNANLVADGVGESRMTGLTDFGFDVIDCCNAHDVLIDVSHLNTSGFKDIINRADRVLASHSNAREIFDHPRNLYDEQIRQIIEKGGMINIVFNPPFVKDGEVAIEDLFLHIDRIIELGGSENIGIGSDFDGIASYIEGLEDAGSFSTLAKILTKKYGNEFTAKITHENFINIYC
ncbi:dipeptidase [Salinicoccus halodurans]|uniref:Diguanylate cyclase n=1 Tax=Salinicoccus halodurans TaxID=407035 RepID=A0A0F7HME6_9STAP|nr:dipeptidase [Salinicoccus halodurans]AKG74286.1 diguanylate cyclase [Salinicoccus halodurans]SFK94015.1 dipeptidase. Metallo peptidase. MEROPS family M19 [Salinicoccus halodurans]